MRIQAFQKIKLYFKTILQRLQKKRQVRACEFRKIAEEVAYLSEIAIRINPEQNQAMERLGRIKDEMSSLTKLVDSSDFIKIPQETKLELRQSLLASREQLVDTIHQAPPPTDMVQ